MGGDQARLCRAQARRIDLLVAVVGAALPEDDQGLLPRPASSAEGQ